MINTFRIRLAHPDDGPALQEIERLAGVRFRDVGLPDIADAEPESIEALAGSRARPRPGAARLHASQLYMSDPGVVSSSPVSSHVFRPERIIGQPP